MRTIAQEVKVILRYFPLNWLTFVGGLAFYADTGSHVHLLLAVIQLPWMAVSVYRIARA